LQKFCVHFAKRGFFPAKTGQRTVVGGAKHHYHGQQKNAGGHTALLEVERAGTRFAGGDILLIVN
jgi:hypothetical protein